MLHEDMSQRTSISPIEEVNEESLPASGRLTPIGGASPDNEYVQSMNDEFNERITLLEEHEKLTASLAALTRHFAHVQLCLQQVVSAPTPEDRENLIKELHEFASNGIPDVMCQPMIYKNDGTSGDLIEAEKRREKEFIHELKQKLDELEHYAAASGSLEGAPTSVTMEKQRVLIDQLRDKLDLKVDDVSVSKLSAEELRKVVDQAIYQLTNPVKIKENLINQMHTQIHDLEKFIEFLKADSAAAAASSPSQAIQSPNMHKSKKSPINTIYAQRLAQTTNPFPTHLQTEHNPPTLLQSMKKFLALTQLYTLLILTCGTRTIQKPTNIPLKKDYLAKKHFGDLRAKLEIAIEKVLQTVQTFEKPSKVDTNDVDDLEDEDFSSTPVIIAVRLVLAPALQALLEHGLYETNYSKSLAIIGCFTPRSGPSITRETMHIWKLFLDYYEMKKGDEFVNSPARKLSETFSLDMIGGKPITIKQYFLSGIDSIVQLHEKHAKSMDTCFKSFVCYALNEKKLVSFLRLILRTSSLLERNYQSWSYTKQTNFNDALHSLDRLTSIDFRLPVDLSVRRFMNNRDLFE